MSLINCFSTLGCPQLSLRQAVDFARERGFAMLEARAVSGSVDLPVMLAREFGRSGVLADYLAASGVSIPVLGSSQRLLGKPFDLGELQRLAEWADAIGAHFLRVFDGDGETLRQSDLEIMAARLALWEQLRTTHGLKVNLVVETHGVLCANTTLESFCNRCADVPILWDTHHTWAAGNDLRQTRAIIGPRLAHLHVKDSTTISGQRSYVLPGQGEFPAAALKSVLAKQPPSDCPVSLEWEALWHPELPDLGLALSSARSWL